MNLFCYKRFTISIAFFLLFLLQSYGQTVTQTWATLASGAGPQGIVIDGSGNVYTANNLKSTVSKITSSGTVTQTWATLTGSSYPTALAIDGSGNVYTTNFNLNTISKITSSGTVTQAWATLTGSTQPNPTAIVIDGSGNVYTANNTNNTISKITSSGTVTQAWATLASGAAPAGIVIDGSGNLYTANSGTNTVSKITSSGIVTQVWASLSSTAYPQGIAIDGSGNVYITNYTDNTVSKITSSGTVTQAWATLNSSANPVGIIVDGSGNVYTANNSNSTVSKITSSGTVTQAWATLNASANPFGIAVDGSGNVYTTNNSTNTVSKITVPTTWNGTTWSNGTPSSTLDAVIASSTTPGTFTCKNLTINSGVALTIGSGVTATVNGNITNSGNGISGVGNLTIASSCTLSGTAISFNGVLKVNTGATLTTANLLTLSSTGTATGSIAAGSGSYLSGNVTVQRYIGSSAQWRMIGFPFTQATTISQSTLAGFYTSGYNAYTYNEGADDQTNYGNSGAANAGWTQFTSGTTSAKNGILLSGGTISSTINFSGTLNTGTQTIALTKAKSGWNFIANPFASAINWTSINANNSSLVNNAIYRYDPGSTAYATYVNAVNTGNQNNVIENGAGFFVQAKSAGNLSIAESDKTSSAPLASLFGLQPVTIPDKSIIKLSLAKQGDHYADEVVVRWGIDPATDDFDGDYDAYDMGRAVGPDLSVIGNDGTVYSIFHGSALQTKDKEQRMIALGIKNMTEGNYTINTSLLSAMYDGNDVFLIDHYTNQTILASTSSASYSFMVTSDANSASTKRFSLALNYKPKIEAGATGILLLNNPSTNNQFNIVMGADYQKVNWQLVDNNGRVMQSGIFSSVTKGSVNIASTQNISSGTYFIKLIADGEVLQTQKWIKQ